MDAAGHAARPTENEEAAVAVGVTPSTGYKGPQRGQNHRRPEGAKKRSSEVEEDKQDDEEEENALFSALEDLAEVVAADLSKGRVNQVVELLKAQQHAISSSTTDLVNSATGEIYAAPAVLLARASVCTMLCAALSRSGRHKEALRQGLDACIQVEWLWTSLLNAEEEEEQQKEHEQEEEEKQEDNHEDEEEALEEASGEPQEEAIEQAQEAGDADAEVAGASNAGVEGEADTTKEEKASMGAGDFPKDASTKVSGNEEVREERKEGKEGDVNGNAEKQESEEETKEKEKEENIVNEKTKEENKEKAKEETTENEKSIGDDDAISKEPQQEEHKEEKSKEESQEEDKQTEEGKAKEAKAEETKKEKESKEDARQEEVSKEQASKEAKLGEESKGNEKEEKEEKKEEEQVKQEDVQKAEEKPEEEMKAEKKPEEEMKTEEKEEEKKKQDGKSEEEDKKEEDKKVEDQKEELMKKEESEGTEKKKEKNNEEEEKKERENKEEETKEEDRNGEEKVVESKEGEHKEKEKNGDGNKEEENRAEGNKVEEKTEEENREEVQQDKVSKEEQCKEEEERKEDNKQEESSKEDPQQQQQQQETDGTEQGAAEPGVEAAAQEEDAEVEQQQQQQQEAHQDEQQQEEAEAIATLQEDDDLFADLPSDAKRLLTRVAETSLQGRHCVALELEFLAGKDMSFAAEAEISRLHAEGANIARTCLDEQHPARVLAESALKEWQRRIGGGPEPGGHPQVADGPSPSEQEGKSDRQPQGKKETAAPLAPEQNRIVFPHTLLCSFARKVNTTFVQRSAASASNGADATAAEPGGDSKPDEGAHDEEDVPPPPAQAQEHVIKEVELAQQPQQERQLQLEGSDAQAFAETEATREGTPAEKEEDMLKQPSQQGVTLPPVGARRPGSDSFRRSATSGNLVKQRVSLPAETDGLHVEPRRPKLARSLTDGVGLPELARTTSSINAETLRATWPHQELLGKKGHQQGKKTKGRMRLPSLSGGPSVSSRSGGMKSARSTRGDTEPQRPRLDVDIFTDWRKHDMGTARSLPSQVLDTEGGIVYFTRKLRHESATFKQVTLRDAMTEDLRNPEGKRKLDMVRYCTEGQRVAMRRHMVVEARRQERERIAMPLEVREKRKEQVRQLFTYYKVGFAGGEPTLRDFTRLMATSSPAEKERKKREEEFRRQREYAEKLAWQRMLDEAQAQRRAFLGAAFGGGGRSPSKRKVQPKRASKRPSVRPPSSTPGRRLHALTT